MFKLKKELKKQRDFSEPGSFLGCIFTNGDNCEWVILEYVSGDDRYYRSKVSVQDPTMTKVETSFTYFHSDIQKSIKTGSWKLKTEVRDV